MKWSFKVIPEDYKYIYGRLVLEYLNKDLFHSE